MHRQKQSKNKKRKPKKKTAASENGLPEPVQGAGTVPSQAEHGGQRHEQRQLAQDARTAGQEAWLQQGRAVAGSAAQADSADPARRWRDDSTGNPDASTGPAGQATTGASDGSDETSDIGRLAHRLGAQWVITPAAPAAVSTVTSLRDFRPLGAAEADGGGGGLSDEADSNDSGDDDDDEESLSDADSDVSEDSCSQNASAPAGNSASVSDGGSAQPQRQAQVGTRPRTRAPTSEVAAMSDVITRFMEGTHGSDSFQVPHAAAETAQLRLWRGEGGAVRVQTPSGLLSVTLQWTFNAA